MKRMYLLNTSLLASVALAANKGTGSAAMKAEPAFTFEDVPLPVSARGGFGARGEPTELAKKLAAVPLDKSFLEAVTISDSISDPAERKNAFDEAAKKLTNRIGGAIRRHRSIAGNELHNFALRTVNDDTMGRGVRIWRVQDATEDEVAKRKRPRKAAAPTQPVVPSPPPPPPPPAQ